jgi:hypothetical protein
MAEINVEMGKDENYQINVEMEKDKNYQIIFSSGVLSNLRPNGASLIFYRDDEELKIDEDGTITSDKVIRKLLIEIKMSPLEFITMTKWFKELSTDFEIALEEAYSKK